MEAYDFTSGRGIGRLVDQVNTIEDESVVKLEQKEPHKLIGKNHDDKIVTETDFTNWLKEPELKTGVLDFDNKKVDLTLENGKVVSIDISDLVDQSTKTVIKDIDVNGTKATLKFTDGTTKELTLQDDFIVKLEWDKVNRVLTGTRVDGDIVNIDIPSDDTKVNDIVKDDEAHTLTYSKGDVNTTIDLDEWVKNYYAENGVLDLDAKKVTIGVNGHDDVVIDITALTDKLDALKKGYSDANYDEANRTLTLTNADGEDKVIDLSKLYENWFITNGTLMLNDGILRLERSEGSNIDINVTEIKDILNELSGNATIKKVLDVKLNDDYTLGVQYSDDSKGTINLKALTAVKKVEVVGNDTLRATDINGTYNDLNISSFGDGKVDKVEGMGLSSNNFTDELKALLELKKVEDVTITGDTLTVLYTDDTNKTLTIDDNVLTSGVLSIGDKKITLSNKDGGSFDIDVTVLMDALDTKVDKVDGMGLSANNLTNELKAKIELVKVRNLTKSGDSTLLVEMTDDTNATINLANINTTDGSLSLDDKQLVLTKGDGSKINIGLDALIDDLNNNVVDVDTNTTTNKLTITKRDGSTKEVDIGAIIGDTKLESATFNSVDNNLTFKLNDGNEISTIINIEVDNSGVADVNLTDSNITVSYKDGSSNVLELPAGNNVKDGSLDFPRGKLILDMKQGANVEIDLDEMVEEVNSKVTAVVGKDLSHNDLTNERLDLLEMQKVTNIEGDNNNTLKVSYTEGNPYYVDLSKYYGVKAEYNDNGKLTFTRGDNSTYDVNITSILDDINAKVDKVDGMGLTHNDLTDDLKAKIEEVKVKSVVGNDADNKIIVTMTDGSTSDILVDGLIDDDTADSGSFALDTKKLTIHRTDGVSFEVDLASLVDEVNNKVDKVAGKGLSSNDLTDTLKDKINEVKIKSVIGDSANNKIVVTATDGSTSDILVDDLISDDVADSGTFTIGTKKLNIHNSDGTDFDVDFASLVDELNNKVNKDGSKVLTTNDLTDALKALIEEDRMIDVVADDINSATKLTLKFRDSADKVITMASGGDKLTTSSLNDANKKIVNTLESGATVDTDLTALYNKVDGKEPSFTKNNAFNKNFGATSTTVARGNHTHAQLHTHANKVTIDKLDYANNQLEYDGVRVDQGGTIKGGTYDFATWSEAVAYVNGTLKNKKIVGSDLIINIASGTDEASSSMLIYGVGDAKYKLIIRGAGETLTIAQRSGTASICYIRDSYVAFEDISFDAQNKSQGAWDIDYANVAVDDSVTIKNSKSSHAIYQKGGVFAGSGFAIQNVGYAIWATDGAVVKLPNMDFDARTDTDVLFNFIFNANSSVEIGGSNIDSKGKASMSIWVSNSSSLYMPNGTIKDFKDNALVSEGASRVTVTGATISSTSSTTTIALYSKKNSYIYSASNTFENIKAILKAEDGNIEIANCTATGISFVGYAIEKGGSVKSSGNNYTATSDLIRWFHMEDGVTNSTGDSFKDGGELATVYYSDTVLRLSNTSLNNVNDVQLRYGATVDTGGQSGITCNVNSGQVTFNGRRAN